ncbi:hypothetical protein IFR05_002207 [Cadophora sp. M221]|nr:hypothetical protein IFR05_002207 [Cadophora sp. M221]
MGSDGDDENSSRSSSPRNMHRPYPPNANYNNFGGDHHGFNFGSKLDRSFGGQSRPYHLPPVMSKGVTLPTIHIGRSTNQAAQVQTSDFPTLGVNIGMRDAGMEDTEMAKPDFLRRTSQYDSQASLTRVNTKPHIFSCKRDERITQSPSLVQVATAAYNIARPYTRLPIIDVLNHSTQTGSLTHNGESSAAAKNGTETNSDVDHTLMTPPKSSPARSRNSISSISSNSTVRPPFNVTERRSYLLNTLYHICMDATSTYITNLPPATRHRHNQLPRHRNHGSRHQPYPSHRSGQAVGGVSNSNSRRCTLMDNIRDISTHMWRRARSDEMAPHRAEADAILTMRDLYAWGEVVAQGMESNGGNVEGGEYAGEGSVGEDPTEIGSLKVAYAARKLCRWLSDRQAWEDCDGVMSELSDLIEVDGLGGRISEIDDESLDESLDGTVA